MLPKEQNIATRKTYQVWHDIGGPQSRIAYLDEGIESGYPISFVQVAEVRANSLKDVVELMTDKGSILEDCSTCEPWEKNHGVEVYVEASRGTAVGDVIVDPGGTPYMVLMEGFGEVLPSYERAAMDLTEKSGRMMHDVANPPDFSAPRSGYDRMLDESARPSHEANNQKER